jgi:hypothetical protein
MQLTGYKQERSSIVVRCLIVLCLALVSIAATSQVLHYHADQTADTATHCALCLVMHSAPAISHPLQLDFSLQTTAFITTSLDPARQPVANWFALFSRPPPLV